MSVVCCMFNTIGLTVYHITALGHFRINSSTSAKCELYFALLPLSVTATDTYTNPSERSDPTNELHVQYHNLLKPLNIAHRQ